MEESIQFMANYSGWTAIKKLKIEAATDSKTVMEFLASLSVSFDRKIEENLRKVIDLSLVDKAMEEVEAGKGKEQIAEIIAQVNGRNVNRAIKEACEKPELQKNEKVELIGFCKVYAMKKTLEKAGLSVDYSSVEIPGMKRIMKKKA